MIVTSCEVWRVLFTGQPLLHAVRGADAADAINVFAGVAAGCVCGLSRHAVAQWNGRQQHVSRVTCVLLNGARAERARVQADADVWGQARGRA